MPISVVFPDDPLGADYTSDNSVLRVVIGQVHAFSDEGAQTGFRERKFDASAGPTAELLVSDRDPSASTSCGLP